MFSINLSSYGIIDEYCKKSKIFHCSIGLYFPVTFIISWHTTPPVNEVIHGISVDEVKQIFFMISSLKISSSFSKDNDFS